MPPDTELGPIGQTISAKLIEAFAPAVLQVIDESHHHAGHAGAHPQGESHFRVVIEAEAFRGRPRVEQHRMVNAVLQEELKQRVHALAIQSKAPPQLSFEILKDDDPRLIALLSAVSLPTGDLTGKSFLGITSADGMLVACGGMERAGEAVLIRSVAVAPEKRRGKLGSTITLKLLAEARNSGAREAYLLTASAVEFFRRLGFEAVERARVPESIRQTSQFTGTACASAQPMVQLLKPL